MRSDPNSQIRSGSWNRRLGWRFFRSRNSRRGSRLTVAGRTLLCLAILVLLGVVWGIRLAWQGNPDLGLSLVSAASPPTTLGGDWVSKPPRSRERFSQARKRADSIDPSGVPRLVEWLAPGDPSPMGPTTSAASDLVRVEYTLDEELTEAIFSIFRRGRVERGQAIVVDPRSGRLLAYVSTDPEGLPPERTYPAASIVKLLTAAALLEEAPVAAEQTCVYRGNKYRLSPRRLAIPKSGHETTLARALASSNNQCFSQWAVHSVGQNKLLAIFQRFGWLAAAAPGHDAGRIDEIKTKLDLGRLGSGLGGVRVNPLHVASLASILTDGRWVEPWWIDRVVDSGGRSIRMPRGEEPRQVLSQEIADRLRRMMVGTTASGTAKSAFRTRRGRRLLGEVDVAGKTGNVTGTDPYGRYEWFLGLAPAEDPTIAVVVLQLQSHLWWSRSSELAAKVLRTVFCDDQGCRDSLADRLTGDLSTWTDPLLISELERPLFISRTN